MFSRTAQTEGTQWGRGGIGNVTFSGVKLSAIFDKLNLEPSPQARFVCAEGVDGPSPGEEDFEHSIPLADVVDSALFALQMNGQPLPQIHGGPVRLVVPGYYATMNVKWLSRLRFESMESTNHNHVPRYRTPDHPIEPGSRFEFTIPNSTPTWKMNVATLVTSHAEQNRVDAGTQRISGWAWNDGRAEIADVLASYDQGESWRRTQLEQNNGPYAWRGWRLDARFQPGTHSVWIRAVDALGRSQPLDGSIAWNPRGYEWNGTEKLTFDVI
jgi:DMSO/TMAO reductase YedYZ molybdopterin-dependent catalytic subunit